MIALCVPEFDPVNPRSAVENMMIQADIALRQDVYPDYLAFIHDDVEIHEKEWQRLVEEFFEMVSKREPIGMVGFGGAYGLGTNDLYKKPYDYRQLARIHFVSNMTDAETHGMRQLNAAPVAVLDGFCQIIRTEAYEAVGGWPAVLSMGITFHMYDAAMACLLAEQKWTTWMLPISCTHYGGRTSTSKEYDQWLRNKGIDGDQEVHSNAHKIIYDRFRNILPLRR